jgi:DNA-binding MarR family transcriptional regulator
MSKTVPLDCANIVNDTCLCFHAQRAARTLAQRFDEVFRPLDLTSGQFSLLISLNRLYSPNMSKAAATMGMDRTTLTATLKPLKRRRLLVIRVYQADRRIRIITLTHAGRALLAKAIPLWRSAHARLEASLPGGDAERLRAQLLALD